MGVLLSLAVAIVSLCVRISNITLCTVDLYNPYLKKHDAGIWNKTDASHVEIPSFTQFTDLFPLGLTVEFSQMPLQHF